MTFIIMCDYGNCHSLIMRYLIIFWMIVVLLHFTDAQCDVICPDGEWYNSYCLVVWSIICCKGYKLYDVAIYLSCKTVCQRIILCEGLCDFIEL